MSFRNRIEAASQLAERLAHYAREHPLVLAIPRGAVPMGKVIAEALDGDLDVVLAAKLPSPGNSEFAIGTVSESGWMQIADWARETAATAEYMERQKQILMEKMRKRREEYTALKAPLDPQGRIVIVVDDGLATGLTMIGALEALKKTQPRKLIVAVPVASASALADVSQHADEVVCLSTPRFFQSVGQHYEDFSQVSDEEVTEILREAALDRTTPRSAVKPAPDAPHR
ncbi:MAG TPA: phosphoribosyltransferase family protein [Methylophilaceae bacterium]|nr:phosphoribosyltransferase family protein [Methylophilaceae bacterium]